MSRQSSVAKMGLSNRYANEISLIAKESDKVKKTRSKLEKRLSRIYSAVTRDEIKETLRQINDRISRYPDRIDIKKKGLELFDENLTSKAASSKIEEKVNTVLESMKIFSDDTDILEKKNIFKL